MPIIDNKRSPNDDVKLIAKTLIDWHLLNPYVREMIGSNVYNPDELYDSYKNIANMYRNLYNDKKTKCKFRRRGHNNVTPEIRFYNFFRKQVALDSNYVYCLDEKVAKLQITWNVDKNIPCFKLIKKKMK